MKIEVNRLFRTLIAGCAAAALVPVSASAQSGPPPGVLIDTPPPLAEVRAKFENMTAAQATAAGYMTTHECVSSPFGGMGIHFIHPELFESQLRSGQMDPQSPPVLLVDSNERVVGLEWETTTNTPQPTFLGQLVPLQPGHPGMEEEHYMVHIYFKPNNKILLGVFDPDLKCASAGAGGVPPGMPRTGNSIPDLLTLSLTLAGGLTMAAAGATLRRRTA
jgi:hypothetical protein